MSNLDNTRPQDLRPLKLSTGSKGAILRIDADGNCLFKAVVASYKNLSVATASFLQNHIILRLKVAEELKKSQYTQAITATLCDEKGVSADAITDEDRQAYLKNIAETGRWGGTPELVAIATLLQVRIIVHQAGAVIKIPQGSDYDTWPVTLELVHESANAGLTQDGTQQTSHNHYNLLLPEQLAKQIIDRFHEDIIRSLKAMIQVCPHPSGDDKVNKNFRGFFFSFREYFRSVQKNEVNDRLRDKAYYHLEMLWSDLISEFMSPMWSYDDNGFNSEEHQRYTSGRIDSRRLRELVKLAIERDERHSFFKAFPYVRNLSLIDDYLNESAPTTDMASDFNDLINRYLITLHYYDQIQPLLVLRELTKIMLNHADVDMRFYKQYMKGAERHLHDRLRVPNSDLVFLSLFIGKFIPYDIRFAAGFRKLDWSAFDGLYRCLFSVGNTLSTARVNALATGLLKYCTELILLVIGKTSEDAVSKVEVSDLAYLNVQQNVTPAFDIIDNYMGVLRSILQDNDIARLATLRAITALGEALRSIELLLPPGHYASLEVIVILRDHIIHASTLEAFTFLNHIISDQSDIQLVDCLSELQQLNGYVVALKGWFGAENQTAQSPPLPQLPHLTQLEKDFAAVRTKDDRDEKIPVAQRLALLGSLPVDNVIVNPYISQVEAFVFDGDPMSREDFKNACPEMSAAEAKKLHERIIEKKKITALKQGIQDQTIDFSRINLHVSKSRKKQIKQIVEQRDTNALSGFLDEHEQKVDLSDEGISNFVDSIRMLDIEPYKTCLRKLADGSQDISKDDYEKAVAVVFRNDDEKQKLWSMTYEMYTRQRINSLKRYQVVQLDHALENLDRLKQTLAPIFDGQGVDVDSTPVVTVACEMLYGFCLEGFRRIKKFLGVMYDYTDQTLYFFQPNHPLDKVESLLKVAIFLRNDIFHFERVFQGGMTIAGSRMIWFSSIQDLTFGTYFPEAIMISKQGVSRQAMLSSPTAAELTQLRESLVADLPRDENYLNMYEARVKEIIARSRITSSTGIAMRSVIPLSQWMRQNLQVKQDPHRDRIFLTLFQYLDIDYLEPTTYVALLNAMASERVMKAEVVMSSVFSSEQLLFAKSIVDREEISSSTNVHLNKPK